MLLALVMAIVLTAAPDRGSALDLPLRLAGGSMVGPPAYRGDAVLLRLVPEASRERAEDDAGNRSRLSNVVTAGPGPLSGLERAALAP